MTLRVVGAGLGRTGTKSLKDALEILLGGPCYHMMEVFGRPQDVAVWSAAVHGKGVDFEALYGDSPYRAAVDWPACAFWQEHAEKYPDALIVLSTRDSAETWWTSASRTIFQGVDRFEADDWRKMIYDMFSGTFTPDWRDEEAAKAAYERHNAEVRATADPARLLDWQASEGWGPLCERLGVPVPDVLFPHTNTTDEFRRMSGLD